MKPILLTLAICAALTGSATVHVITVSNFQFSPANIPNVVVGDVMRWVWQSGSHTTTADPVQQPGTSVPEGATTWDASINSSNTMFEYTVTVAGVYNYWCRPHAPEMAGTFTATGALPIKLAAFSAEIFNGKALLKWKTAEEQNLQYFSVQKSQNGSVFSEVARIMPAAVLQQNDYSFTDNAISAGKYYYYHLVMVDRDGQKQVSQTKMIKSDGKINRLVLSISPNPISSAGHLLLTFNAAKTGTMSVTVRNPQGVPVISTQMQAYVGVNNGHIHLGGLPAGTYAITFLLDGVKETRQVVLQ